MRSFLRGKKGRGRRMGMTGRKITLTIWRFHLRCSPLAPALLDYDWLITIVCV